MDNAVNVRLKQANILPIENLAAGTATQANPNGVSANLIGARTNNITNLPAATENGLDLPLLQGYAENALPATLQQSSQTSDFLKELGLTPQQNANLIEFLRTGDTGKTANSLLTSRYLQAFNEGRTGEPLAEAAGQSGAQGAVLDAAGVRQDADVGAVLSGQRTGELVEGVGDLIDGIKITDGKVGGKIPVDEFKKIRQSSIKNPESTILTLGRFTPTIENGTEDWSKPGPDSYIVKAGSSSYFDLGSDYKIIQKRYGLEDSEMFDYLNKPALDDAISKNKIIRFSHNPLDYEKGAIVDEWEYIKAVLGKTDENLVKIGDYWHVR